MEQQNVEIVGNDKNKKSTKNLIVAGLMSILAGLLGCVVLGLLLTFGFVASISGIVITAAMFYTFQKFYKTTSRWLYVFIVGVAIIEIFVTVLVADGLIVQAAYYNTGRIISYSEAVSIIFSESELVGAFFSDFLMSVLFALIGIGFMIYSLVQKQKHEKAMAMSTLKSDDVIYTPAEVVENKDKENVSDEAKKDDIRSTEKDTDQDKDTDNQD